MEAGVAGLADGVNCRRETDVTLGPAEVEAEVLMLSVSLAEVGRLLPRDVMATFAQP